MPLKFNEHDILPEQFNGHDPKSLALSFRFNLENKLAKDEYSATMQDCYQALSYTIRDRLVHNWIKTQQSYHKNNVKRVYYFSFEYLIGRSLGNNMLNLGLDEACQKAMQDIGLDVETLRDVEGDAGLGNGGLGRLAACFLDSMATLGIPSHGYGIRYEYGMFNQVIQGGWQIETPDEWLKNANPWEIRRPEYMQRVKFYGHVTTKRDSQGRIEMAWENTQDVYAMPYDMPVPGYKNDVVNTLRLWSAIASEEFDMEFFNNGDYLGACENKSRSENISKVLYPNDSISVGQELRLKQQYFFVSASLQDLIRRFRSENTDLHHLPDKAVIQLNDTHPCLAIPELMRLLMDVEQLIWENAWSICNRIFAYTNHTVMPEALEKWSVSLFERMLPRHLQIIYEINTRFLKDLRQCYAGDDNRLRRMSIIEEGPNKMIRMAYLALVASYSVNGVSELHTEILKKSVFKDFYDYCPEKFNSKTNGITQRRWLKKSNPDLSALITDHIGDAWVKDLSKLKALEPFRNDPSFQSAWRHIKRANKIRLAQHVQSECGFSVNPDSIFDVQVKRIHEYKRQLLFALYAIAMYHRIKQAQSAAFYPRTLIVAGKAAPGYDIAKLIIKFINNVGNVINSDPDVKDQLTLVYLPNYRVSLAEKIFPASDVSEQISTAGTEASGTGNMKFALNGALTVGTLDGATIEMMQEIGEENIFTFGLTVDDIGALRAKGYDPKAYVRKSELLSAVMEMIRHNVFSREAYGLFQPLYDLLMHHGDHYMLLADFDAYVACQDRVTSFYQNQEKWTEMSILNVARIGKFSSDRTIQEYNQDIWHIPR